MPSRGRAEPGPGPGASARAASRLVSCGGRGGRPAAQGRRAWARGRLPATHVPTVSELLARLALICRLTLARGRAPVGAPSARAPLLPPEKSHWYPRAKDSPVPGLRAAQAQAQGRTGPRSVPWWAPRHLLPRVVTGQLTALTTAVHAGLVCADGSPARLLDPGGDSAAGRASDQLG